MLHLETFIEVVILSETLKQDSTSAWYKSCLNLQETFKELMIFVRRT